MKHVFWALLTLALIGYSYLVWTWWEEGNLERSAATNCTEYIDYSREQIERVPQGCLREWIEKNQ